MDLKEIALGINPDTHWYYQSKLVPLQQFARQVLDRHPDVRFTLVDIGAGSGFFSSSLAKMFPERIAKVIHVDTGYSEDECLASHGQFIQKQRTIPEVLESAVILMMDVLEHVPDDRQLIDEVRLASRGDCNHLFITVPAFMQLWSYHDTFLGHYRRYTRADLHCLLGDHGDFAYPYYFAILLPFAWFVRRLKGKQAAKSDMNQAGMLANAIFKLALLPDRMLYRFNFFAGLTCMPHGKMTPSVVAVSAELASPARVQVS